MRKKMAIAVIMLLGLVSVPGIKVFAAQEMKMQDEYSCSEANDETERLLDELSFTILDSIEEGKTTEEIAREVKSIEDSLEKDCGCEILTSDEVEARFGIDADVHKRNLRKIKKPANTKYVDWILKPEQTYTYGKKKYSVQSLVAAGKATEGMLYTGNDHLMIKKGENRVVSSIQNLASIYLQKAIGATPVKLIQWSPYELLFGNQNKPLSDTHVSHRCLSTIKFTYVKEAGLSDQYYRLEKFSNKLTISLNINTYYVNSPGDLEYVSKKKKEVERSEHYEEELSAVKVYTEGRQLIDYIPSYKVYGLNQKFIETSYVPNPTSGPGQIH